MNWDNEQHREFTSERSYTGYSGSSAQSSQMFEQSQQQSFYQPEFQSARTHGEQIPYGYPPVSSPVQPMEGARIGAALSYALGWFSGILFLLFAGENRYIRFHSLQSIAFFGAINLLDVVVPLFWMAAARGFHAHWLFPLSFFFLLILNSIAFVGWLVGIIQAGRGVYYKLPFVGEAITRHMGWNTTPK